MIAAAKVSPNFLQGQGGQFSSEVHANLPGQEGFKSTFSRTDLANLDLEKTAHALGDEFDCGAGSLDVGLKVSTNCSQVGNPAVHSSQPFHSVQGAFQLPGVAAHVFGQPIKDFRFKG
jgi:hypothetical protein